MIAALAVVAVPLSNLMVADTPVAPVQTAAQSATIETSDAEASSAVSSLMAGSAVGATRGSIIAPRHPASAFVP